MSWEWNHATVQAQVSKSQWINSDPWDFFSVEFSSCPWIPQTSKHFFENVKNRFGWSKTTRGKLYASQKNYKQFFVKFMLKYHKKGFFSWNWMNLPISYQEKNSKSAAQCDYLPLPCHLKLYIAYMVFTTINRLIRVLLKAPSNIAYDSRTFLQTFKEVV